MHNYNADPAAGLAFFYVSTGKSFCALNFYLLTGVPFCGYT